MMGQNKNWKELGEEFRIIDWQWWKHADIKRAEYYFKQALLQEPNDAELWSKLAEVVNKKESLLHIDKALELEPNNPTYLMQKAETLAKYTDGQEEEGIKIAIRALTLAPNDPELLLKATDIIAESTLILAEKREQDQQYADYWLKLSKQFLQQDLNCDALEAIDKAIALEPENKLLWTTKYWYLQSMNRYFDAEAIPYENLTFKHTIDFKQFLKTGKFGAIELGMSRDGVRELIGDPEGFYGENSKNLDENQLSFPKFSVWVAPDCFPIWSYGPVELFFGDEKGLLTRISFKHINNWTNFWSLDFKVDPWIYKYPLDHSGIVVNGLSLKILKSILDRETISYADVGYGQWNQIPEVGILNLESGVEILYEVIDGEEEISMIHREDESIDTNL